MTTPKEPSPHRRALLRGTLAAPVVLTVSSPAAAVTTFGKCLANQAADAQPQNFFTVSSDNWFRKRVRVAQLKHGNDVDWFYLDPGGNQYVRLSAPSQSTGISAMLDGGWKKVGEGERWALVWVDSKTGSNFSVMQVQRPMGYTAATGTCMASVKPTWQN